MPFHGAGSGGGDSQDPDIFLSCEELRSLDSLTGLGKSPNPRPVRRDENPASKVRCTSRILSGGTEATTNAIATARCVGGCACRLNKSQEYGKLVRHRVMLVAEDAAITARNNMIFRIPSDVGVDRR